MKERLQKFLANKGFGSRRHIEGLIEEARITIDGRIAELGDKVDEDNQLALDSKRIRFSTHPNRATKVLMYYKPEGEICTRFDPEDRPTVYRRLPKLRSGRWVMVGRLDINTSGLLLFTNNGKLANKLMHPSSEVERKYAVRVLGEVTPEIIDKLLKGVKLEDGFARFGSIEEAGGEGANRWYNVTLHEGRNREVRRLFESQDLQVSRLMRIQFGPIKLPKDLARGRSRLLEAKELALLVG